MRITKKILKKLNACQDGIDFMVRNNLEGYDWDKIDAIEGDYKSFISWLRGFKNLKFVDDKLTYKNSYGRSKEFTYDEKGNKLTYKNSSGFSEEYTYERKNGYFIVTENDKEILKINLKYIKE